MTDTPALRTWRDWPGRITARYRRLFWPVSLIVLAGTLFVSFMFLAESGSLGYDAWAYWRPPHIGTTLYAGTAQGDTWLGVYRYSPAFLDLLTPLNALPWVPFLLVWIGLLLGTLIWLAGRWTLLVLAIPFVAADVLQGNVNLLLAAAIVIGFRHPAAWALVLITKVSPGVGLVWFAARREWRSLAIALLATGLLIAVSVVWHGPELWSAWLMSLGHTATPTTGSNLPIPLAVRIVLAMLLVAWGARTNRRWTVIVGATFALPIVWWPSLSLLVGLLGLRWLEDERPGPIAR